MMEKGRGLTRETGRFDKQNSRRERYVALEKGRKTRAQEKRSRETQKSDWGTGINIAVSL